MTITDLCCDGCGKPLPGPGSGVRFVYHPGVPALRDDSGLACGTCWQTLTDAFGTPGEAAGCAVCRAPVPRRESLHVRRFDDPASWRLCAEHAIGFLNALRTVEPKLEPATFRFPASR